MAIVLYDALGRPLRRAIGYLLEYVRPVEPGPDLISSTDIPEPTDDDGDEETDAS